MLLHLQQGVHRAPAAVVGSRCRGYIVAVAFHAQVQVVAAKPDAHGRVVEVTKCQVLVRGDLAPQPEECFLRHLHQAPGLYGRGGIRVKPALRADKRVDQQRVQLIDLRPLLHKGLIFAGVELLLHLIADRRHREHHHPHQHQKHQGFHQFFQNGRATPSFQAASASNCSHSVLAEASSASSAPSLQRT